MLSAAIMAAVVAVRVVARVVAKRAEPRVAVLAVQKAGAVDRADKEALRAMEGDSARE